MTYAVVGINHKVAPIEVRELFCLNSLQQDLLLSEFKSDPRVAEAFVLSTCNRLEIHLHHIQWDAPDVRRQIIAKVARIKGLPFPEDFQEYFYTLTADAAIRHLLEVITGLDSLVIGEKQILGQAKTAFEKARSAGMLGKYFNLLTALAARAGKKARTETDIGCGGSSVSWAAIAMAEQNLGSLKGKSLLLIGAGKMGELAAGQIANKGFQNLYLINRTHANARALADKYRAKALPFCDIKDVFPKIDICICAADAPHHIIDYTMVERISRRQAGRPLILIDISMPRNIDPRVAELPAIKLYDIDDLNRPIAETMQKRQAAIADVRAIIERKQIEFAAKWHNSAVNVHLFKSPARQT